MALTKAQKAARAADQAAAAAVKERQKIIDGAAGPDAPGVSVPASGKKPQFKSEGSMGPKIILPSAPAIHGKTVGGGRMVVVVCKIPRGLYLQLHTKISQDQRVVGGGVEKREVSMPVGDQVRLKPSVLEFGLIPNYPIVNGFSLTEVDANFWNEWYAQNPKFSMFEAGLLCAFDNEADARAYCREYGTLKHGLEPLAQSGDKRIEQPTSKNLTNLDIDTDVPAARN